MTSVSSSGEPGPRLETSWVRGTWFITGCSSGIGRALAACVLAAGGRVAATARDATRIDLDLGDHGLALDLDLTRPETFRPALDAASGAFGPIDVLVNNAGYGLLGAVEETSDEERRAQLEANFFGPTALTTLLLPELRTRRRGLIINVTSVSGVRGPPGSAYYAASKHAVEGWSDSLRAELAPFGVQVMVVEPGAYRTDFFGRSRRPAATQLGLYEAVDRRRVEDRSYAKRAKGDPDRGAEAIVEAIGTGAPPRRLALGSQANAAIRQILESRVSELADWSDTSARGDAVDDTD